ncbi:GntR family transcriptional regulator [Domibacillus sp. PGB-M46]|uniref:FadR/GntR family transcriptional regulator n=1 Tax=Domibacillus sp. PGB-M46 TaxID=2910255 RepID=UPI001F5A6062|nr:FCD domain-containing protein [Domibacillus sp. PGB-M46]MCI2255795.1 GntR family transcriptional regulator [Domibacillus sp. PGB-M46]
MQIKENITKVNKQKLVDQVLTQLQGIIQSEKYKVGDKLPAESELMKLFNVGRSTIRESIRILVYSGLLEVRQGDGTYIRSTEHLLSEDPLQKKLQHVEGQELNELIQILDIELSGLAAQRRTENDLHKIKQQLDLRNQYLKEKKYDEYLKADIHFHVEICKAAHNSALTEMYDFVCKLLHQMFDTVLLDTKDYYKENTQVHQNLYMAIANQSVEDAKRWAKANVKLRNNLSF